MTDTPCLYTTGSLAFGTAGFSAAAGSHLGCCRETNEDRYELDPQAGFMLVVDGIGGHAAGEVAAALAADAIRRRMRHAPTPADEGIRDAILRANQRIFERSALEPELKGMACVLTLAVVSDGGLTVGHVGDSRLYKLSAGGISKLTHDHSPIGDREDRGELTETEAMRHPRRNEVFRDVGSRPREAADEDFIELFTISLERDAAVLLCSDGLSDMVTSVEIQRMVRKDAGDPEAVVAALIDAANAAGGKDNITIVYAEGPDFPDRIRTGATLPLTRTAIGGEAQVLTPERTEPSSRHAWRQYAGLVLAALMGVLSTLVLANYPGKDASAKATTTLVVGHLHGAPFPTIAAAMQKAAAGDIVSLEPGTYAEEVILPAGVTLKARLAGSAVMVARADRPDWTSVLALGGRSEIRGIHFRGAPAEPIHTAIRVSAGDAAIDDISMTGIVGVGLDVRRPSTVSVTAVTFNRISGVPIRLGDLTTSVIRKNFFVSPTGGTLAAIENRDDSASTIEDNLFLQFPSILTKPGSRDLGSTGNFMFAPQVPALPGR